jgi:hypothetical protein
MLLGYSLVIQILHITDTMDKTLIKIDIIILSSFFNYWFDELDIFRFYKARYFSKTKSRLD